MSLGAALKWMNGLGIYVDPEGASESVYVPLLDRSKGTTYEEKVAALQKLPKKKAEIRGERDQKAHDNGRRCCLLRTHD